MKREKSKLLREAPRSHIEHHMGSATVCSLFISGPEQCEQQKTENVNNPR